MPPLMKIPDSFTERGNPFRSLFSVLNQAPETIYLPQPEACPFYTQINDFLFLRNSRLVYICPKGPKL